MMLLIHLLCYEHHISIYIKNPLNKENVCLFSNNVGKNTARTMPVTFWAKSLDYLFPKITNDFGIPVVFSSVLDDSLTPCQTNRKLSIINSLSQLS